MASDSRHVPSNVNAQNQRHSGWVMCVCECKFTEAKLLHILRHHEPLVWSWGLTSLLISWWRETTRAILSKRSVFPRSALWSLSSWRLYTCGHGRTQDVGMGNDKPRFKVFTRWEAVCRQFPVCIENLCWLFVLPWWRWQLMVRYQGGWGSCIGQFCAVKNCPTSCPVLEYSTGLICTWRNRFITIQSSILTLCYIVI